MPRDFIDKMSESASNSFNNPIYCRVCGKQILNEDQHEDQLNEEKRLKAHMSCIRRRKAGNKSRRKGG